MLALRPKPDGARLMSAALLPPDARLPSVFARPSLTDAKGGQHQQPAWCLRR